MKDAMRPQSMGKKPGVDRKARGGYTLALLPSSSARFSSLLLSGCIYPAVLQRCCILNVQRQFSGRYTAGIVVAGADPVA